MKEKKASLEKADRGNLYSRYVLQNNSHILKGKYLNVPQNSENVENIFMYMCSMCYMNSAYIITFNSNIYTHVKILEIH